MSAEPAEARSNGAPAEHDGARSEGGAPGNGQQPGGGRRRRRRRRRRGHGGDRPSPSVSGATEAAARRLGIQRLYHEQQRIIGEVGNGRDLLVVLPTGYGK